PQPNEMDELEKECERLRHATKLREGALLAESLLYSEDGSAFDRLGKALAELGSLRRYDDELGQTHDTLEEARRIINEAARELQHYGDSIEADPQRLEFIEQRLADLTRLCRKHGGDYAELLA